MKGVGSKAIEAIIAARERTDRSPACTTSASRRGQPAREPARDREPGQVRRVRLDRARTARGCSAALDDVMRWAARRAEERASPQIGLFAARDGTVDSAPPPLPDVRALERRGGAQAEREAIGFFITGHPLDRYLAGPAQVHERHRRDAPHARPRAARVANGRPGRTRVRRGVIHTRHSSRNSKKGDRYATFVLEDHEGRGRGDRLAGHLPTVRGAIRAREPVVVTGGLDISAERCQILRRGGHAARPRARAAAHRGEVVTSPTHVEAPRASDPGSSGSVDVLDSSTSGRLRRPSCTCSARRLRRPSSRVPPNTLRVRVRANRVSMRSRAFSGREELSVPAPRLAESTGVDARARDPRRTRPAEERAECAESTGRARRGSPTPPASTSSADDRRRSARIHPATFVGTGKVDDGARASLERGRARTSSSSTIRSRRRSSATSRSASRCKVIDRSALILDIFAQRARPRGASCRSSWRSSSTCCRA